MEVVHNLGSVIVLVSKVSLGKFSMAECLHHFVYVALRRPSILDRYVDQCSLSERSFPLKFKTLPGQFMIRRILKMSADLATSFLDGDRNAST